MVANINTALNRLRKTAKNQLQRSEIPPNSSHYATISEAIERGDIITANELIAQLDSLEAVAAAKPHSLRPRPFSDFYPLRSEAIETAIESQSPNQIIQQIATADAFGGMTLTAVSPERRESAERMLVAWYDLRRARRLRDSAGADIERLFSELGFIVRQVRLTRRDDRDLGEAIVETERLDRRERCPIPEFGSSANGKYRILFLWGSPTEQDILQHADEGTGRRATIVLCFSGLNTTRRAALARLARERSQSLLLIDELLVLYLCGETDSRVPILFACSLPLAYVQPYVTTAGLIPPEMFYGREREMRDIADPNESCFIYGGRQLGKTALLRAVENMYHRPADGLYAVWIDLKREGIGTDRVYERGVAGIWSAIWRPSKRRLRFRMTSRNPIPTSEAVLIGSPNSSSIISTRNPGEGFYCYWTKPTSSWKSTPGRYKAARGVSIA